MKYSNWIKMVVLALITTVFISKVSAQNETKTTTEQEWKLMKKKNKGAAWHLYKRKLPNSKFQEVKIVGKINCSMQEAQSKSMEFFVDSNAYISKKGKSLGWFKVFKHTDEEIELYSFMKGNFMTKDRDVVVRYQTYSDTVEKAMGVQWHQIEKEGYEASDSIIRMPVDMGNWRFEEIDSQSCMATMMFQFHPGGSPPAWMINMIVKYYAPHELDHLRALCEEDEQ